MTPRDARAALPKEVREAVGRVMDRWERIKARAKPNADGHNYVTIEIEVDGTFDPFARGLNDLLCALALAAGPGGEGEKEGANA